MESISEIGQYGKHIRNSLEVLKCNAGECWRRAVRFEKNTGCVGINEIFGRVRVTTFAVEKQ